MKLISWNVNGLRACITKGFETFFDAVDADAFCLQETKMQQGQADIAFDGYTSFWNSADKKGYSGTAVFTRLKPVHVKYDLVIPMQENEGRVITLDFGKLYLVNVYTPNSQRGLSRLSYRMDWDNAFREYVTALDRVKPVVICGDMNVAHEEIDLKNPKPNMGEAGFTDEERRKMTELLRAGFIDTFRYLHPDEKSAYTWWSYMYHAREHNAGWRIDYFLVSKRICNRIKDSQIYGSVMGSDHCPIGLSLDI